MENEKNFAGYDGMCPACGSGDGIIIQGKDGRFRNFCRVMGCPLMYLPAPAVGFDTADDCRNPFETAYLADGSVSIREYKTGKKTEGGNRNMLEVDCRKCANLTNPTEGCKLYGPDADEAVKACAADAFEHYKPQEGVAENEPNV